MGFADSSPSHISLAEKTTFLRPVQTRRQKVHVHHFAQGCGSAAIVFEFFSLEKRLLGFKILLTRRIKTKKCQKVNVLPNYEWALLTLLPLIYFVLRCLVLV